MKPKQIGLLALLALAPAAGAQPVDEERGAYMLRALDHLINNQGEFIDVALRETPKTRNEALMMDVFAGADSLHYYAKRAKKLLAPERSAANRRSRNVPVPAGCHGPSAHCARC